MPVETDDLTLPDLLQELNRHYGAQVSYSSLWQVVVSGRVPAKRVGRSYRVERRNTSRAAEVLGLIARPNAA